MPDGEGLILAVWYAAVGVFTLYALRVRRS